jgi:hypothetical protein
MRTYKLLASLAAFMLVAAATLGTLQAKTSTITSGRGAEKSSLAPSSRIREPLNLAILIQDDLVSRVGNELNVTREFIRALPGGSRVMVGYITSGTLQVRQQFTTDLERAASSLRIPTGSTAASPYNPYVEVREALRRFDIEGTNRNALLLISDGLDVSRGFDFTSSVRSLDLERAIREAKSREVAVYTFYAPSVGLTSWNRQAISFGQSALNRIADETGGEAFFQGTSFVTFNSYFNKLGQMINKQYSTE